MIRLLNLGGILLALVLSLTSFRFAVMPGSEVNRNVLPRVDGDVRYVELADGSRAILDHSDRPLAVKEYQRIASASTIADALLLEFVSPERVVSFTHYSQANELFGHKFAGKPQIDALGNVEQLLRLKPDLLVVSTLSAETRVERLKEIGLNVFVLGQMRGLQAYLQNARLLAALVGKPELGQLYAETFERRMHNVAANLPQRERKTAIQLAYYGKSIYGSGRDTSYNDVLTAAGLIDLAAKHYEGWPPLSPDQVLALDPEIIVTRVGMGDYLCQHVALSRLRACQDARTGIVEVPNALINDPGAMMLPSAELIYQAVYGDEK